MQPNPVPPDYGSWWNDDPSTHCYRNFWKYCPSHCSTHHIKWRDYEHIQNVRRTKIMLYGMYDAAALDQKRGGSINAAIPLARSWEYAPGLTINSAGFSGGSYDKTERAYKLTRSNPSADELSVTINASSNSPVYNPCLVISGWDAEVEMTTGRPAPDRSDGLPPGHRELGRRQRIPGGLVQTPVDITGCDHILAGGGARLSGRRQRATGRSTPTT